MVRSPLANPGSATGHRGSIFGIIGRMAFLLPNQQRKSTEKNCLKSHNFITPEYYERTTSGRTDNNLALTMAAVFADCSYLSVAR